jgi:hypothetical protein
MMIWPLLWLSPCAFLVADHHNEQTVELAAGHNEQAGVSCIRRNTSK